jgi:hypothetical protein
MYRKSYLVQSLPLLHRCHRPPQTHRNIWHYLPRFGSFPRFCVGQIAQIEVKCQVLLRSRTIPTIIPLDRIDILQFTRFQSIEQETEFEEESGGPQSSTQNRLIKQKLLFVIQWIGEDGIRWTTWSLFVQFVMFEKRQKKITGQWNSIDPRQNPPNKSYSMHAHTS